MLASIEAGKPVFCEKPLATTQEACLRIIEAEVAGGRRLVQVGYMRRYDPAYRALKEVVRSGAIGAPLLVHSRHRNPSVPEHYTREMAITDTAVHDFDVVRWLLDEEIVATTVLVPRRNRHGGDLQDPLLMLLETESGVLVDVETSVNIRYGYDIQGEVVGEDGTAALGDASPVIVRRDGTVRRAGARRLAGAVHPCVRHRVPGVGRHPGRGRGSHGAVLVGRVCRRSRLRRRCRGANTPAAAQP